MHPAGSTYAASFGPGQYRVYTCMDLKGVGFDIGKPKEFGTYLGNSPIRGLVDGGQEYTGYRSELGALLGFKTRGGAPGSGQEEATGIYVRAGMSFISSDQACANAEAEIPDFDFEGVRSATREAWNELLGRVQVETEGVDSDTVTLFYTSLYRTHISPADCESFLRFCWFGGGGSLCACRFRGEPALELDGAVLRLVLLQRESSREIMRHDMSDEFALSGIPTELCTR